MDKQLKQKLKGFLRKVFFKTKRNLGLKITLISVIGTIGLLIYYLQDFKSDSSLLTVLKAIPHVAVILTVLLYILSYLIVLTTRKSGLHESYGNLLKEYTISSVTQRRFLQIDSDEHYFIDSPIKSEYEYSFVNSREYGRISGELNFKAFKSSPWMDSEKDKITRNTAHALKNKNCILLIKEKNGDFIGFTHIIPLTQRAWDDYTNGLISDNDFSSEYIAPSKKKYRTHYAEGVLIFSIALLGKNYSLYSEKRLKGLFQAIHYHLYKLSEIEFSKKGEMQVLIQTADKQLNKLITRSNLTKLNCLSKDKCDMYKGTIMIK